MRDVRTPQWLIDIQNRSWEPEILISGITLTSLFLLSGSVYNLFGMLIQEYGVLYVQMHILFTISTVILMGLKIVLIAHLILRGLWTGLVGLSYVYPLGIRRHRLSPADRTLDFPSPSDLVIQVERVCSLLFAFIFASFSFFISMYLIYIPSIFIRFLFSNEQPYFFANVFYFLILIPAIVLIARRMTRNIASRPRVKTRILVNMYLVFSTNVGHLKLTALLAVFFAATVGLSMPDILSFEFRNRSSETGRSAGVVLVDEDKYESERAPSSRVQKATLNDFAIDEDHLSVFVSYYKEDDCALRRGQSDEQAVTGLFPHLSTSELGLADLYRVSIDTVVVEHVAWYKIRKSQTGQTGFAATIDISSLPPGIHEVKIDKVIWRRGREEPTIVENWDRIPFEKRAPHRPEQTRIAGSGAGNPDEAAGEGADSSVVATPRTASQ